MGFNTIDYGRLWRLGDTLNTWDDHGKSWETRKNSREFREQVRGKWMVRNVFQVREEGLATM